MTVATPENLFPGYRFGPNGECELFQRAEDVPEGWTRVHPANRPEARREPSGAAPEAAAPQDNPFDHDGDGRPGGSLPGPRRAVKGKPRHARK